MAYGFNEDKSKVEVLPISGGELDGTLIMTDELLLQSSNIDRDDNPSTSRQGDSLLRLVDSDNEYLGGVYAFRFANGVQRTTLQVANKDTDDTVRFNAIGVDVARNGDKSYSVSAPSAFCEALHVGDHVNKDQSTAVSVADSTWTNICSVDLVAGTWVLRGNIEFTSNSTGRRYASLSSTSGSFNNSCGASVNAVSGGATHINLCSVIIPSTSTTIYLIGYQNSGNTLNVKGYIRAVRIK